MAVIDWLKSKLDISDKLYQGGCGGAYSEAMIIVCSLLSGISAQLWPKSLDRKRFVELITQYATPDLGVKRISLPFMYQDCVRNGKIELADKLVYRYNKLKDWTTQIFIDDDIDIFEDELKVLGITALDMRAYSYANLIYKKLRCDLVHEYLLSDLVSSIPSTRRECDISYTNRLNREKLHITIHMIHIHYPWINKVTASIINSTASLMEKDVIIKKPAIWWIDG